MKTNLSRTLLPLVAALAIAGCATAPEALPEPLGALPATFKDGGVQWIDRAMAAQTKADDRFSAMEDEGWQG